MFWRAVYGAFCGYFVGVLWLFWRVLVGVLWGILRGVSIGVLRGAWGVSRGVLCRVMAPEAGIGSDRHGSEGSDIGSRYGKIS